MSSSPDSTEALRRAATIIQRLEHRIQAMNLAKTEPIAIVGVGCRLPGNVHDLATFWHALHTRPDTVGPIPPSRFQGAAVPLGNLPTATDAITRGSFLASVEDFDAGFWGISAGEASWMDPQHRVLLECVWEALEHAGVAPTKLQGHRVGVYVSSGINDYASYLPPDTENPEEAFVGRLGSSFAAGRISSLLKLHGPSLAVDTACSSSLVAAHLACQALHSGDCELALVGGVQVIVSLKPFVLLSRLGALAPDGRCKPFLNEANGYGRGEGCGVLVLKRLSDANAAGDRVLGLIRGTAVNHDGPRSGRAAPNGAAQKDVMHQALLSAGLSAADVDYVEAHAIGTALGDAIELDAISETYSRARNGPVRVGSLKGLMGHSEPASGVVGILKILASLEHGVLPMGVGDGPLNSNIDWNNAPLVNLVRKDESWDRGNRPRRAGVSAFGLGGTNAHVVIEEAPERANGDDGRKQSAYVISLSAKTPEALNDVARRLFHHVESSPGPTLCELASNLATTRAVMDHRVVLVASTRQSLSASLLAIARGDTPPDAFRTSIEANYSESMWLLGDSTLAPGTGRQLSEEWPVFRAALAAACEAIDDEVRVPLRSVLWSEPATANAALLETESYAQPAVFAIGWALSALWKSWGIHPNLLAGYGCGEITAACLGGVMSLTDAAQLACERGNLHQQLGSAAQQPSMPSEPALASFSRAAEAITFGQAASASSWLSVSSSGSDRSSAPYWIRQALTGPPSGEELLTLLAGTGTRRILELSPCDESCANAMRTNVILLRSLHPGAAETHSILSALAGGVAQGDSPDWAGVFVGTSNRVRLPLYPWQRRRYWMPSGSDPDLGRSTVARSTVARST